LAMSRAGIHRQLGADGARRGRGGAAYRLRWLPLQPSPRPLSAAPGLRPAQLSPRQAWHDIGVAVRRHRRLIAAGLVGLAAALAVGALAPKPPPTVVVVTAAHDLAAGATLTAADLRPVAVPPSVVPAGAVFDAALIVGHQLSGPLRRGEPLTDVRLDEGLLHRPGGGLVSVPVRLADIQAARLLRVGQRVDVLAANTSTEPGAAPTAAAVVAASVAVVAIPVASAVGSLNADPGADVGGEGALVVLATTPLQARQLAQAQVSARLSAVVVG
ncbi:MAG: pilus assembly protein CpaB, partial [Actinomycetota bacterium]|nr:pilus assembly protein CpaB [Actinomycetota bacterium]